MSFPKVGVIESAMLTLLAVIIAFFALVAELAMAAIGFSPSAFRQAATSADAQSAALIIAFLAGMSEMLGQSVILVVNRVALYRFVASIALTGAAYALTVLTWSIAVLAVAPLTRLGAIGLGDFAAITGVLALAFAPRLFGIFSIAPYFGVAISNVLEVWAMALAIFGLHVGLDLPMGAAVFCGGVGFIVSYVFRTTISRFFAKPIGRLRQAVAGSTLDKSPRQLLDDIMASLDRKAPR